MKKLPMCLDLTGIKIDEESKQKTSHEIFANVVEQMMVGYINQQQGAQEQDRALFYDVRRAVRKAAAEQAESVELEDAWWGFLKRVRRDGKFIPNDLLERVEDIFSSVKER